MIKSIKIFNDNLVWLIYKKNKCIIIDPGLSEPIIKKLEKNKLVPILILITHMHYDHINGVSNLVKNYPKIKVFTPKIIKKVCKKNQIIVKRKNIFIFNKLLYIFPTPGHTKFDLSYYSYPYLFCGDTLFSAGCGNTKDGCSKKLYRSLKKIQFLPKETIFFNSHQYTLSNLKFTKKIYQKNPLIEEYLDFLKKNHKKNIINYSFMKFEKKINLFLRTHKKEVREIINYWYFSEKEEEFFCNLRKIKDQY
jgi:hydroxyacylglutathione hydrolase